MTFPIWNSNKARIQLLFTFQAIFETGGVASAAESLELTQSAVSKHLKQLRLWFKDELFVRINQRMEPTDRALVISTQVKSILSGLEALGQISAFDPFTMERTFTIVTTDELSAYLLPGMMEIMEQQAPKIRLTLKALESDFTTKELESGKVDLIIGVNWFAPDQLLQRKLFGDRFVCMMRKNHPLSQEQMFIEQYVNAKHVMVAPLGKTRGFMDTMLAEMGYKRSLTVSIPYFMQAGALLKNSNMIITLPSKVAKELNKDNQFTIKELPFEVPLLDYYLLWHKRNHNDEGNQWIRSKIFEVLNKD